VGDFVLVIDDNTPKGEWPRGRVVEAIPSKVDGHVRTVKVLIMGHSKPSARPITRLRLLYTNFPIGILAVFEMCLFLSFFFLDFLDFLRAPILFLSSIDGSTD